MIGPWRPPPSSDPRREELIEWHELLRLQIGELTVDGLLDLHQYVDHLLSGNHVGHVEPPPRESLPPSVRTPLTGPKE
jgi:hypothetical protein